MFETLTMAPADPIIGLTEAFENDPNSDKINLGVGVYKDGDGNTPIFASVKTAEERLLTHEDTKNYLGIEGDEAYNKAVQELLWGADHEILTSGRAGNSPGTRGHGRVAHCGRLYSSTLPQCPRMAERSHLGKSPQNF